MEDCIILPFNEESRDILEEWVITVGANYFDANFEMDTVPLIPLMLSARVCPRFRLFGPNNMQEHEKERSSSTILGTCPLPVWI